MELTREEYPESQIVEAPPDRGEANLTAAVRPEGEDRVVIVSSAGDVDADDLVAVTIAGQRAEGRVVAGTGDVLHAPGCVEGRITARRLVEPPDRAEEALESVERHPGHRFPSLGSAFDSGKVAGTVIRLDIPNGTVRVQNSQGEEIDVSWPPTAE